MTYVRRTCGTSATPPRSRRRARLHDPKGHVARTMNAAADRRPSLLLGQASVARASISTPWITMRGGCRSIAFGAGVCVVAASFDTMSYDGNYQGVVPALQWTNGALRAGANVSCIGSRRTARGLYGAGDSCPARSRRRQCVRASGRRRRRCRHRRRCQSGLGMGHVMVMPALFGAWTSSTYRRSSATAGYSRAIGGIAITIMARGRSSSRC